MDAEERFLLTKACVEYKNYTKIKGQRRVEPERTPRAVVTTEQPSTFEVCLVISIEVQKLMQI